MRPLTPLSLLLLTGCAVHLPTMTINTGFSGGPVVKGSGPAITTSRSAKSVQKIVVMGGIDLEANPGSPQVKVSAQKNIEPLIETSFSGGTLTIKPKGSYSTTAPIKVLVQMPSLTELETTGGSHANVTGYARADLNLAASGGAEIVWYGDANRITGQATGGATVRLSGTAQSAILTGTGAGAVDLDRLDGGELNLELSGASRSSIPGRAGKLRIEASGASEANLGTLTSDQAEVNASGASTVKIGRTNRGSITASGASTVQYKGTVGQKEATGESDIVSR